MHSRSPVCSSSALAQLSAVRGGDDDRGVEAARPEQAPPAGQRREAGAPTAGRPLQAGRAAAGARPAARPSHRCRAAARLVIGGLDQADASSSAILRISGANVEQVGRLPAALHDGTAATIGSRRCSSSGGGNAGSSSRAVDLVSPGGFVDAARLAAVAASDRRAAPVAARSTWSAATTGQPADTIVRVGPAELTSWRTCRSRSAMRRSPRRAVTVVIAGGTVGQAATDASSTFDPATRKVNRLGRLPAPPTHAAAATMDGRSSSLGGRGGPDSQRSTSSRSTRRLGRVRRAGHLPLALSDLSAASSTAERLESSAAATPPAGARRDLARATAGERAAARRRRCATRAIPPLATRRTSMPRTAPASLSAVARRARATYTCPTRSRTRSM